MKKEKKEIAINTSSGAEKVEKIEKEMKTEGGNVEEVAMKAKSEKTPTKEQSAKAEAALGSERKETKVSAKKVNAASSDGKAERESRAAKARVEAALKRKELQEKRKAERLERAEKRKAERAKRIAQEHAALEKRLADRKAAIEKRAAQKKAQAEKRKAEKEAAIRERAHAKANKNQTNAKKKAQRSNRKKERNERRGERNKGYGGWLAAVISLGAVTLALTTAVTVGAIDLSRTKKAAMASYKGTMYELTGIMEHVDDDLDRARISASKMQQARILTDLLVQARLAELDLEKMPIPVESDRNITTFINHTAAVCERLLAKLRRGEALSAADMETLERLYQTNHSIRMELDELMGSMQDKDLMDYIKDGMGTVGETLGRLEDLTLEENRAAMEKAKDEMKKNMPKMPENTDDEQANGIDPARAEALCGQYFSEYKIADFQCIGETVTRSYKAYNVQGYDENGSMLFAELDQKDGTLLRFDYYEECTSDTFDLQNAERIAQQFIQTLGYTDMEVVRFRENGTTTDFTFVYEADGVAYYPDEVRVKVCRTRGVVSGMDATKFLKNHKNRIEPSVSITMGEAADKLYKGLEIQSSRLAVVKANKGERAAYEFLCGYQGEMYFVYVDANTGEEIAIVNTKNVA